MVGVVILASMRGQFRGQLHSVAEPAAEPEAAGQLARIWHNWDEALLKEVVSKITLLSSCSTIVNTCKQCNLSQRSPRDATDARRTPEGRPTDAQQTPKGCITDAQGTHNGCPRDAPGTSNGRQRDA